MAMSGQFRKSSLVISDKNLPRPEGAVFSNLVFYKISIDFRGAG